MRKKSAQIALGGLFSSLCIVLLFMTGLFPFATYALPALAGGMLVAVVIEMGTKTALTVYASAMLLSAIVVADKEAVLMFAFFFGHYPILKGKLETLRPRLLEYALKLAVFNASVIFSYLIIINVFGITEVMQEFGEFGKYGQWIVLAIANVVFVLYDIALTRYISLYVHVLRKKILHR